MPPEGKITLSRRIRGQRARCVLRIYLSASLRADHSPAQELYPPRHLPTM